jgi:peptide chain release factor subunit 3
VEPAPPKKKGTDKPKEKKKEVKGKSKAEKKAKSPEKKEEVDSTPKHSFSAHDQREHLNIVFIGHVDAGKSTISGQILLLTGQVDERTIAKYEKEAKEKKRDSWYIAYIMDTSEEERQKGKTVEVGRAHFTTEKRRFTLLDAPGHRTFVPNMIGGAAQADVGVLVISARKGEFETGFERGGQTREHAQLAKTLGIQQLIVMVNKMDEKTVSWAQSRYDEIVSKLTPFLRQWGYKPTDLTFLPVSGQTGANMKQRLDATLCPWYQGPSFFELLDSIPPVNRKDNAPLRIPIMARYKESGKVHVLGKVEAGTLVKDQTLLINPTQLTVQCVGIIIDEKEAEIAKCGENAEILVKGVEDESAIPIGFVLSYPAFPTKKAKMFDAQVAVLDLLPHKPLITAGYGAVLHVHAVSVECQIHRLISESDGKGKQKGGRPRYLKSNSHGVIRVVLEETISIEAFDECAQLGRFTLRDEGRTIAVGRVLTVYEQKQIDKAAADKAEGTSS